MGNLCEYVLLTYLGFLNFNFAPFKVFQLLVIMSVDEGYSSNVPDEGYSRNASCALNLISTTLLYEEIKQTTVL